ncbi:tail fiber assembly protein [Pseudomonas sp. NPDC090755]|uniref:tail fiber assembly protein n=1 Tax=Pseudomonas sp. NPDC090755 TaxID=3364481 RepID=UPI00383BD134
MSIVYVYVVDGAIVGISGSPQSPMNEIEWVEMEDSDPVVVQWLEARKPSAEALVLAKRDSLLRIAALRIAPLQDAVDIEEATDAEKAELVLWKKYRVALNRVQDQPGYPDTINWPAMPG